MPIQVRWLPSRKRTRRPRRPRNKPKRLKRRREKTGRTGVNKGQVTLLGIGCAFLALITASAQSIPPVTQTVALRFSIDRTDVDRAQALGLQQAIDLALKQASDFTTAELNEKIASEDIRQARAALLPKFEAKPN